MKQEYHHSVLQNKSCSLSPQMQLHRHLLQDTAIIVYSVSTDSQQTLVAIPNTIL